jgi:tetratricopeptide (TPR) repeat protein
MRTIIGIFINPNASIYCSKTQIALEYAYCRQKATSCSIFWVHADSEAGFTKDYSEIAKRANLSPELNGEDLLRAVQQWIEQQTGWLLILDNVDEIRIFKKSSNCEVDNEQLLSPELLRFVPKGPNGTVIWTSRDGAILGRLVGVNQGIKVGAMTDEESLRLFQRLCGETLTEKPSDVEQLLDLLQRLPLAIAQAAAYIRRTKVSTRAYLRVFRESEKRQSNLLSEGFDDVHRLGVPNSVMFTWLISMKRISQESQCGESILNVVAFLDNKRLPFELIKAAAGPEYDEGLVLSAAGRLMEYSFLQAQRTVDEGLPVYEQHRLVQLAARRALNVQQARLYSGKALRIMTDLFPNGMFETWGSCKLYLPHALKAVAWVGAEGYSDLAPTLLSRIGIYYLGQGRFEEAEQLLVQVLELHKNVSGEKHPQIIRAMANLATTWRRQGRFEEAGRVDEQVLELHKNVLGEKHPGTIKAMANLASTWCQQGRFEEAEQLGIQALGLQKDVLGEKHPDTIRAMSNLAGIWYQQGRFEEVEQFGIHALGLQKDMLGEKHPDTISTMANLASTWRQQGRFEEAEQLLVQVVELRKSVLGNKHPNTVAAIEYLAYSRQHRSL